MGSVGLNLKSQHVIGEASQYQLLSAEKRDRHSDPVLGSKKYSSCTEAHSNINTHQSQTD